MSVPRRGRRRVALTLLAALVVDAGIAAVATAPAGAARASAESAATGQQENDAVATLKIITPNASIRREGKDEFKPAKDGAKLHVGDTIQTDATGFVEISYAKDALTRLDVNTTFTIEGIVDDQGNRTIKGKVDEGQTWNRVEGLTQNESFEQDGAGATAAVTGTAFAYQCDAPGHCVLTTVVHGVTYSTQDGELKVLDPLLQCEATEVDETNSDLCDVPTELTEAALLANSWLMTNLFLDGLLGYPGPIFGVIIVEDGVVTQVTQVIAPTTPPVEQPPTIPDPAVNITFSEGDFQDPGVYDYIETDDDSEVWFELLGNVPNGGTYVIIFTDLFNGPNPIGTLYFQDGEGWTEVQLGEQYTSDTSFIFDPNDIGFPGGLSVTELLEAYSETDSFTFVIQDQNGQQSQPSTVDVTVYDNDYFCDCLSTTGAPPASSGSAPRTSTKPADENKKQKVTSPAPEPAPEPAPATTSTDTSASSDTAPTG